MLPSNIEIKVIEQDWSIRYMACKTKLELFQRPDCELVLVGKIHDQSSCKKKLVEWAKEQACLHLRPLLHTVSEQIQLPYKTVTIRDQHTRWGSCSSEKTISLNYRLIFLPLALVRHILIHELCHTIHLNHSDKFWNLVSTFDSNMLEHKRALRRASQLVPTWL